MASSTLRQIALVGTARALGASGTTQAEVDGLTLPHAEPERKLLLRAGAHAIYRLAGVEAQRGPSTPEVSAPESLPECSPGMADILRTLLQWEHIEVLLEALARLHQQRRRLPHALLPLALDNTRDDVRPAIALVLGERGRWLSQFKPSWQWATSTSASASRDELKAIWEDGTLAQRVEALRTMRGIEPATARDWIRATWKREKADTRSSMIRAMADGLSADDESLLTMAATDRVDDVRSRAVGLLALIPGSAVAQRLQARGEAALTLTHGALEVTPPKAIDAQWVADGLQESYGPGRGERARWLIQVLGKVPPSHWAAHFHLSPREIISAITSSPWRINALEGWTIATRTYAEKAWAHPLWDAWLAVSEADLQQASGTRHGYCAWLASWIPLDVLEAHALSVLAGGPFAEDLNGVLTVLPQPWPVTIASAYLAGLRDFAASLTPESKTAEPWDDTLPMAAAALPPSHFVEAQQHFTLPDSKHWQITYFANHLETFADTIHLRQRIYKETEA